MPTFNANQILDKTLFAKKQIVAYNGSPGSASKFVINSGSNIGRVFSWATPTTDKTQVWWMFHQGNSKDGKVFWVKHETGAFDIKALVDEGAKTTAQETQEKKDKEDFDQKGAFRFYFEKYAPYVGGGAAAIAIIKAIISKPSSNER